MFFSTYLATPTATPESCSAPRRERNLASIRWRRTLRGIGGKLVLVEDPEATEKMMAGAEKRKRPLRRLKLLPSPATSKARAPRD